MIVITSGKMNIPESERNIGVAGDNLHSQKQFLLTDVAEQNCIYRLYLTFKSGATNYFVVDSEVVDGSTILTWNIKEEHIFESGIVKAQIKSINPDGVICHTEYDYFIVSSAMEYSEPFESKHNAEFLEYEKKLNELIGKLDNSLNGFVNSSRRIAGVDLSKDISVAQLCSAMGVFPIRITNQTPTVSTEGEEKQLLIANVSGENLLYFCAQVNDYGSTKQYDWRFIGSLNSDGGADITDEQVATAVEAYLDNHPEATTTVTDGSITNAKFADDVNKRFESLSSGVSEYTIEPSTLTVGYRMGGQGGTTVAAQNTSAVTDYIAIPLDTKRVEFCNNIFELHNQNCYCSTFDKDKVFIRNIQAVQIFDTLENERYVRFTCYDSDGTFEDNRNVKFYANSYYSDIAKSKEICSNMSSVLGGSLKIIPELIEGYRLCSSTGWIAATTNIYKCSDIIEIPLGVSKIVHSFVGANTSYCAYAVYDKDLNLVVSGSEDTIEVADNYAYLRLCNYDTTATHANLYCEFVFGNTKEVIDNVVEQTANLTEAVNTSMYKTEEQYLYRIPYEMENSGYVKPNSTNTGVTTDLNTGWRNAKFPVSVGDILSYCVIPYGQCYLVVVDENDKPLDSLRDSVNADLEGSYTVTNEKAKYMYISSRVNCTNFYIKKDNAQVSKLPSDYEIQAINKKIASLEALLKNNGMELNLLPDDYMIELARVEGETKAVKDDNTITFAVMADAHYDGTQDEMLRLADVLKELQTDGVIDFTVGVGDMLENQNTPYTDFTQILTDRGITYGLVRGNHDLFKPSILRANATNIEGVVFDTLGDWYYLDNEDKGVRYIFLNSCDKGTDVDNDTNTITMFFRGVSYRQLNWLANTALKTDKKVVIFNHCPVTSSATSSVLGGTVDSNYHSMGAIIQAFTQGTSGTIAYTIEYTENGASDSIAYDFSEQGSGTVIANFCGHSHGDRYTQNDGEIMEVWTDNALAFDNCGSNLCYNGAVIPDTVDEIAFDVVTINPDTNTIYCKRFGRGKDRNVNGSAAQ